MPYNELRKDYLLDRWVVIATERSRRPTDFAKSKHAVDQTAVCPLCSGNEHMTTPAVLLYLKGEDGKVVKSKDENGSRRKDWIVRCIPNLYPAFSPPKQSADAEHILENERFGYGIGHHEVIIESSVHSDQTATMPLLQLIHVINAYKDRLAAISAQPYVKYVQVFRNYGIDAGASLSHPHSQIIGMPFTPKIVKEEIAASKTHYENTGQCIFCGLAKTEAQGPRGILDNEHFTVFAPYASVHPLEFWVVPKRHSPNPLDLTTEETQAFAQTLQSALNALKNLVNDPPYNYGIHLTINKTQQAYYHWHLEVYPKLANWAGFEKSTCTYINTIPPETAAAELKKHVA
ncbi:MAG: DUF4921 family protein [Candidatus Bathyarchaeota archaeon]|nr:DUF4921 family protein [Candidatus Bathyarchaeota archaeon]